MGGESPFFDTEEAMKHDPDDPPVQDAWGGMIGEIASTLRIIMALLAGILIVLVFNTALAYADGPHRTGSEAWWGEQQLTPRTQLRLHVSWTSCCEHGDACKTCQFRVERKPPYADEWWFKTTDGHWRLVPGDEVHHVAYTPTGGPVLFLFPYDSNPRIKKGDPVCLKVPPAGG